MPVPIPPNKKPIIKIRMTKIEKALRRIYETELKKLLFSTRVGLPTVRFFNVDFTFLLLLSYDLLFDSFILV